MSLSGSLECEYSLNGTLQELTSLSGELSLPVGGGEGGTTNYNALYNKPRINGTELKGNLTTEDLGIEISGVSDVLVNGASIVNDGVANIPLATQGVIRYGVAGLSKYNQYGGISVNNSGEVRVIQATDRHIDNRFSITSTSGVGFLAPINIDYAVKQAMCDGKGTEWTSTEKASARERMGLEWKLLGDVTVEEDGVTKIEIPIDNPNYNEYQFYVYVADRTNVTASNLTVSLNGITSTQYALTYFGIASNTTYVLRGYTIRHCNNGWLTNALGSNNGKPCTNSYAKAVDYYLNANIDTEHPSRIGVALATGLDVGSRFVVYAR